MSPVHACRFFVKIIQVARRSPELHCAKASFILHVRQFKLLKSGEMLSLARIQNGSRHLLLTVLMEINSAHFALELIEAYVVEAFKASAADGTDTMIRHQEMLLPPHEYVVALRQVWNMEVGPFRLLF